jgi:hypothetical protein
LIIGLGPAKRQNVIASFRLLNPETKAFQTLKFEKILKLGWREKVPGDLFENRLA